MKPKPEWRRRKDALRPKYVKVADRVPPGAIMAAIERVNGRGKESKP